MHACAAQCREHELCAGSRAMQGVRMCLRKHVQIRLEGCCACGALRVRGGCVCHLPGEMHGRAHLLCQSRSVLAGVASAMAPLRMLAWEAPEKASLPWRCSSLCT